MRAVLSKHLFTFHGHMEEFKGRSVVSVQIFKDFLCPQYPESGGVVWGC